MPGSVFYCLFSTSGLVCPASSIKWPACQFVRLWQHLAAAGFACLPCNRLSMFLCRCALACLEAVRFSLRVS